MDRDNSKREIRKRLKSWGATEVEVALKVLTRDDAPPLTDSVAWKAFPLGDYDVVTVDSLDSSAEGVGEKDSAKPSKAFASLLNVAHTADGPAILVLGNTVKTAQHGRGSGVIEDRADIVYEVRDATGLKPTGKKPWWEELPEAGVKGWAQRAARRKGHKKFWLAFIPSKFRIGEEPDPFIYEIDLGDEWTMRDVTDKVVQAGEEALEEDARAKQNKLDKAADSLSLEVQIRFKADDPIRKGESESFLQNLGLTQKVARKLIKARDGKQWKIVQQTDRKGKPKILVPLENSQSTTEIKDNGNPDSKGVPKGDVSVSRSGPGQRKSSDLEPCNDGHLKVSVFPSATSRKPLVSRDKGEKPKRTAVSLARGVPSVDLPPAPQIDASPRGYYSFVRERHSIYHRRSVQKLAPPWTKDPILQSKRFCNVFRHLDRGSQWIIEHIVKPYRKTPKSLVWGIVVSRVFNRIDRLEELGPPTGPDFNR